MNRKSKLLVIFQVIFISYTFQFAQVELEKEMNQYFHPDELVSFSEHIPFNRAIEILSAINEKYTGRTIRSLIDKKDPIGIEIKQTPYWKALKIIVQFNNLFYETKENAIIIQQKDEIKNLDTKTYADIEEGQVKISALFFEANTAKLQEQGINWQLLLSKSGVTIGSGLVTFGQPSTNNSESEESSAIPPQFMNEISHDFTSGDYQGNITALFNFFQSQNLGQVIANPSIIVRNGQVGRIQIGSDISIKQRDFAGNVLDAFVSTGSIVEVTPYIYKQDGIEYALLKLKLERSSVSPDVTRTEIRKTTASTDVLMLDGEETVIGGLFVTDIVNVRRGIPFLKDLPWWVLGIRYIAGYDYESEEKKEIIILLKTEIMPSLKERFANKSIQNNLIKKEIQNGNDYIQKNKVYDIGSELTEIGVKK